MSSEKSVPGVAVPPGVTLTVIGVSLGFESETVNAAVVAGSPVLPSVTASGVEFVIERFGAVSSLVIVPVRAFSGSNRRVDRFREIELERFIRLELIVAVDQNRHGLCQWIIIFSVLGSLADQTLRPYLQADNRFSHCRRAVNSFYANHCRNRNH